MVVGGEAVGVSRIHHQLLGLGNVVWVLGQPVNADGVSLIQVAVPVDIAEAGPGGNRFIAGGPGRAWEEGLPHLGKAQLVNVGQFLAVDGQEHGAAHLGILEGRRCPFHVGQSLKGEAGRVDHAQPVGFPIVLEGHHVGQGQQGPAMDYVHLVIMEGRDEAVLVSNVKCLLSVGEGKVVLEVVGVAFELPGLADLQAALNEDEGTGTDDVIRVVEEFFGIFPSFQHVLGQNGHKVHREEGEERGRSGELGFHCNGVGINGLRAVVVRGDVLHPGAGNVLLDHAIEAVDHVIGGNRLAIRPDGVFPQLEGNGQTVVGPFPALCEVAD